MGLTSGSARGDIPPIVTGEYVFVILMEVVGTIALGTRQISRADSCAQTRTQAGRRGWHELPGRVDQRAGVSFQLAVLSIDG